MFRLEVEILIGQHKALQAFGIQGLSFEVSGLGLQGFGN